MDLKKLKRTVATKFVLFMVLLGPARQPFPALDFHSPDPEGRKGVGRGIGQLQRVYAKGPISFDSGDLVKMVRMKRKLHPLPQLW